MRRAALLTVAGLVLLPVWRGLDRPLAAPQNRIEQSDRETRPLSIDATGSVNISNIAGDITIVTGAGRRRSGSSAALMLVARPRRRPRWRQ